jgi:hypothetical protein
MIVGITGHSVTGVPPGSSLDERLTTLTCGKVLVAKSKKVNAGCKPAKCSNEGFGSIGVVS